MPNWDNDKVEGLFRKACAGNALAAGMSLDQSNCHLGWEGEPQNLSYTGASLDAEVDTLSGFTQGASRDIGRRTISPIPPHEGERCRSTASERLCVECVFTVLHCRTYAWDSSVKGCVSSQMSAW